MTIQQNRSEPSRDLAETRLSVVIPTRGRGDLVCRTLRSVLDTEAGWFDVVVVDQSSDDATCDAVEPLLRDPRLRYLRSSTKGISAARNVGVRHSRAPLIFHTDDDCEVAPEALENFVETFRCRPRLGMAFGSVIAGSSSSKGFIPSYQVAARQFACSIFEKHKIEGIGACFGYRRATWDALGGFDEELGVGGRYRAAEEVDLTVRALAAGIQVMETPKVSVLHHGLRLWDHADSLITDYLYGVGAMSAKQFRRGCWSYSYPLARLALRWAFGAPRVDLGHQSRKLLRIRAFGRGFYEAAFD